MNFELGLLTGMIAHVGHAVIRGSRYNYLRRLDEEMGKRYLKEVGLVDVIAFFVGSFIPDIAALIEGARQLVQ